MSLSPDVRPKDVYLRVIATVNAGDSAGLDDLLAVDMVDHNPMPDQPAGRDGFKAWMAAVRSSFPDFNCTAKTVLSEGDLVAAHVIWRGTQRGPFLGLPPTNRAVSVEAHHIVRVNSGLIVEWWGIPDLLGAAQQLGGQIVRSPDPPEESKPVDWFA